MKHMSTPARLPRLGRRLGRLVFCAGLVLGPAHGLAAQPKPSPDEFVPVAEAPPGEQIPAIPLVAAAYGFVWVALVGYTWSLAVRLKKVEREIAELERRAADDVDGRATHGAG